jgi:hypothetical protein
MLSNQRGMTGWSSSLELVAGRRRAIALLLVQKSRETLVLLSAGAARRTPVFVATVEPHVRSPNDGDN